MDPVASTSTSSTDSGISSSKRCKLIDEKREDAIITTMMNDVGKFGGRILTIAVKRERTDEDYRGLYRLYRATLKALDFLEIECRDLQYELEPLSTSVDAILKPNSDNVKVWSQYFFKNPSPTKISKLKTIPSPTTEQIACLLHSVASFIGLTAEAVCSNKRKPENRANMEYLLGVAKRAIQALETHHDDIEKILEPYMIAKGQGIKKR